jgi:hypothetical protein
LQLLFYGFEKANLVCPFSQMLCWKRMTVCVFQFRGSRIVAW